MTKTTQSLTTQLRDVAWAFCVEVWGEALNTAGLVVDSSFKGSDKIYYPLLFASFQALPSPPNLSSTSSVAKSTATSTTVPTSKKDKEQPAPTPITELESEEVVEVEIVKKKKSWALIPFTLRLSLLNL